MSSVPKSFTAVGVGTALAVKAGQAYAYFLSGTFSATIVLQKSLNGGQTWETVSSHTAAASGILNNHGPDNILARFICSAFTSGTAVTTLQDMGNIADNARIATLLGSMPTVAGLTLQAGFSESGAFSLKFYLQGVQVPHTDAAGSGASGSLKLFDFVKGTIQTIHSRRSLTWTGDALIDGDAGDMAFKTGLGSVAANAGDGALTSTEVDFGAISGTLTLSTYTIAETTYAAAGAAIVDGTGTAADLFLNESATAATSEANGFLSATGTIEVIGVIAKNA